MNPLHDETTGETKEACGLCPSEAVERRERNALALYLVFVVLYFCS